MKTRHVATACYSESTIALTVDPRVPPLSLNPGRVQICSNLLPLLHTVFKMSTNTTFLAISSIVQSIEFHFHIFNSMLKQVEVFSQLLTAICN